MKMKKIIFEVSDDILGRIDEAAISEGFPTRSEFLRFLIVTYLKANPVRQRGESPAEVAELAGLDEFADVDCEYGIPPDVIRKLEEKARLMTENERLRQS